MRKWKWLFFGLIASLLVVAGCQNDEEQQRNQNDEDQEENEVSKEADEETAETDEEEEAVSAEDRDEDQMLSGEIVVNEDEQLIEVHGESNLEPDTEVVVKVFEHPFVLLRNQLFKTPTSVQEDGAFTLDVELDDEFFPTYNGQYMEVSLEVEPDASGNDITEAYGETGEKFSGPFVYEYELFDIQHKLSASTYILLGEDETEYAIEAPEREELPDDYGKTDIWMEAEVVDNDHRYLYVEGKSNLLEGVNLFGSYYTDEEEHFSQETYANKMYVEPDGTFRIPVAYDSITEDGYIEIRSAPANKHRIMDKIHDAYGEDYEQLSGDVVEQVDDHQEIVLTIDTEGIDIDAPEDSLVTEEDGQLKINVPDDVLFDFDKSNLKSDAQNTLEDVIAILEDIEAGTTIEINGHTDNQGEADYNLDLSEERAEEVEKYITENGDVDHLAIAMRGYGETKPIASNEEEEGREKNRRVEIVIEKIE